MMEIALALIRDTAGSFAAMVIGVAGCFTVAVCVLTIERRDTRRLERQHELKLAETEAARKMVEHHPEPRGF